MSTYTFNSGTGYNVIRYPSGTCKDNGGSGYTHIVGYEDGRYRIERYTFVAPTSVTLSNGTTETVSSISGISLAFKRPTYNTNYAFGAGNPANFCFYISTDSNAWQTMNLSSGGTGSITKTTGGPTGSASISLTPGTRYYIYVY
jgi:hypothetical protein